MKTIIIIAIFFCKVLLSYTLECPQSPSFVPVNSDVQLSNQLPTPIQAIIPSLRFECQSLITGGNIRVVGASSFDLQVWRPRDATVTGTFYNLVWRREFRRRRTASSSMNALVNSSFAMSPGVPVRPGDVIGFYSSEFARFLYTSSQQDEIIYTGANQGPLCNFSLTEAGLQRQTSALPLISLTYVNVTNRVIQAAEQRLSLLGNSCTTVTTLDTITTQSTVTINGNSSSSQQVTTFPISSNNINGSGTTDDSSDDNRFLSLSLLEFILVVVILAVVVISILVVVIVACGCCLYMQRMRVANSNCEDTAKPDETHIPMNMNPVYQAIKAQTLTQRDHPPYVVSQSQYMSLTSQASPPCTNQLSTCTTECQQPAPSVCRTEQPQTCTGHESQEAPQIALVPPCNQAAKCAGKPLDTTSHQISNDSHSNSQVHQQQLHPPSIDDYSYPNLRVQWFQGHQQYQRTSDGYIIIQPDQYRQDSHGTVDTTNMENHGSRGVMDHTL